MNTTLCDKYKPNKISELMGDTHSTSEILRLLKNFNKIDTKCILVTGPHGSGKTCRVEIALKKTGYTTRQLNIMSFKQSKNPELYIRELTSSMNITSYFNCLKPQKCAIVIDELNIDALALERDQLVYLMKLNNECAICPIIFIFDNKHSKLINTLRKGAYEIVIPEPTDNDMIKLLNYICHCEQIKITKNATDELIKFMQHDFRRLCISLGDIVNDAGNNPITIERIMEYKNIMASKDVSINLFRSTQLLLTCYNSIDECMRIYENEKVNIPLMIHQNYPSTLMSSEQLTSNDVYRITNALSFGDVVDNYVYGEQRWDITNVHGFYSCCIPSYMLRSARYTKTEFPVDMNKTSIQKLNKKHIMLASRAFNSVDPYDYIFIGKIFLSLIQNNDIEQVIKLMKRYKLSFDKLENILKIDKNEQNKVVFSTKLKKILKNI